MVKAKRGLNNLESIIAPGMRGQQVCSHTPEGAQYVPTEGWNNQNNTSERSTPYTDPRDFRIPPGERI